MARRYTVSELQALDVPQDAYRIDGNRHAGQLLKWWLKSPETPISLHVDLANVLNVSASSVSRWLVGIRRPRPHTLRLLKDLSGLEFYGWQSQAPWSPFERGAGPRLSLSSGDRPTREAAHMNLLADYRMPVSGISETVFRPFEEVQQVLHAAGRTPSTADWDPEDKSHLRSVLVSVRGVLKKDVRGRSLDAALDIVVRKLGVSPEKLDDEMDRQGLTLAGLTGEEGALSRCVVCGLPKREKHDPLGPLCSSCDDSDELHSGGRVEIAPLT